MLQRLSKPLLSNSFFLFGPRGAGKSSLLHSLFDRQNCLWLDLLIPEVWEAYHHEPSRLAREIESGQYEWVVIDEVQKVPRLLDVVHSVIENTKYQSPLFALTGSSSRRFKQAGVNLLAGRAFVSHLFPFLSSELGSKFNLEQALNYGLFPKVWALKTTLEKQEFLRSYTATYLASEIKGEQWVRNLEDFHAFLPIMAQMNGQLINYSAISRDVGVESHTIQNYVSILEDTLLGFRVEPYSRSIRKRQKQSAKFYFIDVGLRRAFDRTLHFELQSKTSEYGWAFEHFLILEIYKLNLYLRTDYTLSYLRTGDDVDIDLILHRAGEPETLIEIKSKNKITESDFKNILHFKKDFPSGKLFLLSQDSAAQMFQGVQALPWQKFLTSFFKTA